MGGGANRGVTTNVGSEYSIVARRVIAEGSVEALVDNARTIGHRAAQNRLTTSQIRAVFGEVRRIEMNWRVDGGDAAKDSYRRVVLLQPKLVYQAKRDAPVRLLADVLIPCISEIRDADEKNRKRYFERFVDFFEAILAYHKDAGGK